MVQDIQEGGPAHEAGVRRGDLLLGVDGGMLVANPVPAESEIPREEMEIYIARALDNAESDEITGKAVTPYLLDNLFLGDLMKACAELKQWECQLTIAALRIEGGTGSPVNPIALL